MPQRWAAQCRPQLSSRQLLSRAGQVSRVPEGVVTRSNRRAHSFSRQTLEGTMCMCRGAQCHGGGQHSAGVRSAASSCSAGLARSAGRPAQGSPAPKTPCRSSATRHSTACQVLPTRQRPVFISRSWSIRALLMNAIAPVHRVLHCITCSAQPDTLCQPANSASASVRRCARLAQSSTVVLQP